jgi:hypothetical protein
MANHLNQSLSFAVFIREREQQSYHIYYTLISIAVSLPILGDSAKMMG